MDAIHEEFVKLLHELLSASSDRVPKVLDAVSAHTQMHFTQEERWMQDSDFPAAACHVKEHEAVLASIAGVTRKVAAGQVCAARDLARALIDWFPGHAVYLDSALAQWLCSQSLGGKPVVFRRSSLSPSHTTG